MISVSRLILVVVVVDVYSAVSRKRMTAMVIAGVVQVNIRPLLCLVGKWRDSDLISL